MDLWLPPAKSSDMSSRDFHLARLIRSMLSIDPAHRPVAEHVLSDINFCDRMSNMESIPMFGTCCRTSYVSKSFHDEAVSALNAELGRVKEECSSLKRSLNDAVKAKALALADKAQTEVSTNLLDWNSALTGDSAASWRSEKLFNNSRNPNHFKTTKNKDAKSNNTVSSN